MCRFYDLTVINTIKNYIINDQVSLKSLDKQKLNMISAKYKLDLKSATPIN